MSLVTSASIWNNDDDNTIINQKKRTSTMRRSTSKPISINNHALALASNEFVSQSENYQNLEPTSFEDNQTAVASRNTRVNDILNKITSVNNDDDNSKMGSFKPLPNPNIHVKKDMTDDTDPKQYVAPKISYLNAITNQKGANYTANDADIGKLSNYKTSYETPAYKPYYAKMGIGANALGDDKLIEKINYMIHLMEEQQLEKTSNITEEFILYTFLGVFIIFVVDSFARSGKYIR